MGSCIWTFEPYQGKELRMLVLFVTTCLLVILTEAASITDDQDTCWAAAEQAGVDIENFRYHVGHVIHSLTVEDVRYFFNENFPVNNNIPTVNTNLTGPAVLLQTPSFPSKFKFPMGSTLDRILLNNDEPDYFSERGYTTLEELAHAAHMLDMLYTTSQVYKSLDLDANAVCPCLVDDEANGIIEELEFIAEVSHIKIDNTKTTEEQDLRIADSCTNPEPRKGRARIMAVQNSGYIKTPCPPPYAPPCPRNARKIMVCPDVPELTDSGSWKIFQHDIAEPFGRVEGAGQMATNAAIYFYCKIAMMQQ